MLQLITIPNFSLLAETLVQDSEMITIDERLTRTCPLCGGELKQDSKYGGTDCQDCYESFSNGEQYLSSNAIDQLFNSNIFLDLKVLVLNEKAGTIEELKIKQLKQFRFTALPIPDIRLQNKLKGA